MDFKSVLAQISDNIINALVVLLVSAALVYFFVGMLKYFQQTGNEKGREGARNMMVYGIIGLFAIISVWGLVNVVVNSFSGLDRNRLHNIPGRTTQ